ncbi:MAG: PAS domain S-box protein [Gammaproteobacteria bacterium]|nr:PAS domain S-box protein [Gammaproteobacteria bacterium]
MNKNQICELHMALEYIWWFTAVIVALGTANVFLLRKLNKHKKQEKESRQFLEYLETTIAERTAQLAEANFRKEREAAARKRGEQTILKEKTRAAQYLAIAGTMIVALDLEGKVTLINKRVCEVLGCEDETVLGNDWVETVIPQDQREEVRRVFKQILSGEMAEVERIESKVLTKQGEQRLIAWNNSFVRDEEGNITSTLSAGEDITSQRRAEDALRRREAVLEALSMAAKRFLQESRWEETITDVLAHIGRTIDVSRVYVFENCTEPDDGRLLMCHRYEWTVADSRPQLDNPELQKLPYENFDNLRMAETFAKGETTWALVRNLPEQQQNFFAALDIKSFLMVPIFLNREWWGFIGFDEGRTEREWSAIEKEGLQTLATTLGAAMGRSDAERALRKSEEHVRLLLESAGAGIYGVDRDGNCTICNQAGLDLLGYQHVDELIGKDIHALIHHTRADGTLCSRGECSIQQALRKGKGVRAEDEIFWRADGVSFPVEYRSYPMRRGDKVLGAVISFVDISERKKAEEMLRESEEHHRTLFTRTPISVWQEDFSAVGAWLDKLRGNGVKDLTAYLRDRPQALRDAIKLVKVLNANETALEVFEANSKEQLYESLPLIFSGETFRVFEEELLAIWEGRSHVELESSGITLKGRRVNHLLQWAVPMPDGHADLSKVIVAGLDITERKHTELALKESELRYRSLVELSPEAILVHCKEKIVFSNPAGIELLGASNAEELIGKSLLELVHPNYRDTARERIIEVVNGAESVSYIEEKYLRCDGNVVDVEAAAARIPYGGEEAVQVVIRDIAERKKAERALRLAAAVFDTTFEGIMVTDSKNRIVTVNRAFTAITGYQFEDVTGRDPRMLKSGRHDDAYYQTMWEELQSAGRWCGEIWNRRKSGEIFPEWLSIATIRDADGEIAQYVALFSDITQRKRAEEVVLHRANHDTLTGLPNRMLFMERLSHAVINGQRHNLCVALLFIDLDRFKWVNDTLGHVAGDRLLQETARRLGGCVREPDTVARLGGDEFTVILTDVPEPGNAGRVANRILECLAKPFNIGGKEAVISGSVGITLFPMDAEDIEGLLKNADAAMYRAKEGGSNAYRFFTPEMNTHASRKMNLERELRHALEEQEFVLLYQPILDLTTEQVMGVEVLLRWRHAERGLLAAGEFVPLAEETGLIMPIGEWVLRNACIQAAAWQAEGLPLSLVSVNLSIKQCQADFTALFKRILAETGADARLLALEVTENTVMSELEEGIAALRDIRNMGVRIFIDDFGTGYSSLSWLKLFPVDMLKIDRSFVRDISRDPKDRALVEAIFTMARSLHIEVTAEGIEKKKQLKFLRRQNCRFGQGFYFSQPLPPDAVRKFVQSQEKHLGKQK